MSKVYTGKGSTFAIGGTSVGNIKTYSMTPAKWTLEDITNLNSPVQGPGIVKEQMPTMVAPGDFTASVYYVPTDQGISALRGAFANAALSTFTVQLGVDTNGNAQTTTGDSYSWSGYVTDMPSPDSVDPTKPLTYKIAVTMVTVPSYTQGS